MTNLITPDMLNRIATTLTPERAREMSDLLNDLCPDYGLTNKTAFKMFLANVLHESGEFARKSENMVYTTAERIRAVWPSRFPAVKDAEPFVRKPEALANKVYGGRMGNTESNDGWTYRGGGFIQLTGKEMYAKYAKNLDKNIEETANLVRSTDHYALDSALWFFCVHKKLTCVAEKGDFRAVVKGINGGYVGIKDRQKYYSLAKKYVP